MHGKLPSDGPAPVMAENDGFVPPIMSHDGLDITYQVVHQVILSSIGFITQIVATQIKSNDLVVVRECDHLVAPCIPKVRKAMYHDNQRSLANPGVVNAYSLIVSIMMYHVLFDIFRDEGCRVLHIFPFTCFFL